MRLMWKMWMQMNRHLAGATPCNTHCNTKMPDVDVWSCHHHAAGATHSHTLQHTATHAHLIWTSEIAIGL